MINILAIGVGGFLGAIFRYLISLIPVSESFVFPIKTFIINVIGCIAIGIITVFTSKNAVSSPALILFLKVGLCGGFTTFSTFALETADLIKSGHTAVAFLYAILSVLIGASVIFATEYINIK